MGTSKTPTNHNDNRHKQLPRHTPNAPELYTTQHLRLCLTNLLRHSRHGHEQGINKPIRIIFDKTHEYQKAEPMWPKRAKASVEIIYPVCFEIAAGRQQRDVYLKHGDGGIKIPPENAQASYQVTTLFIQNILASRKL